ncbi:unnamed protein product [Amoebophrya sp. A120]|nr:unnamed protein product [Amoebophrya sp. A120]|eukprot:GSA120T00026000001.1
MYQANLWNFSQCPHSSLMHKEHLPAHSKTRKKNTNLFDDDIFLIYFTPSSSTPRHQPTQCSERFYCDTFQAVAVIISPSYNEQEQQREPIISKSRSRGFFLIRTSRGPRPRRKTSTGASGGSTSRSSEFISRPDFALQPNRKKSQRQQYNGKHEQS